MKTKVLTTILMMVIGGFIGLQSTVSNTAKAETEIVHIFHTDTVTNTIIDKRIIVETDTIVRSSVKTIPVRDEIWAAKAIRLVPLYETTPNFRVEEEVTNICTNVPID